MTDRMHYSDPEIDAMLVAICGYITGGMDEDDAAQKILDNLWRAGWCLARVSTPYCGSCGETWHLGHRCPDASSNRVFPCSRNCTSAAEAGCSYPDCVDAIPNRVCGDTGKFPPCWLKPGHEGAHANATGSSWDATRNREAALDDAASAIREAVAAFDGVHPEINYLWEAQERIQQALRRHHEDA